MILYKVESEVKMRLLVIIRTPIFNRKIDCTISTYLFLITRLTELRQLQLLLCTILYTALLNSITKQVNT